MAFPQLDALRAMGDPQKAAEMATYHKAVSYTHLTLPTSDIV